MGYLKKLFPKTSSFTNFSGYLFDFSFNLDTYSSAVNNFLRGYAKSFFSCSHGFVLVVNSSLKIFRKLFTRKISFQKKIHVNFFSRGRVRIPRGSFLVRPCSSGHPCFQLLRFNTKLHCFTSKISCLIIKKLQ